MKRKEFLQIVTPLTERFYRFAYNIIPDDLQAEQLVIDGVNAFLIKNKKNILDKEFDPEDRKALPILRKYYLKSILSYMADIGVRRYWQLNEQMKLTKPREFAPFFNLDPKVRAVLSLRYDLQFTVTEIEDMMQMPRYEVIEKLHNGRYLLLNQTGLEMRI